MIFSLFTRLWGQWRRTLSLTILWPMLGLMVGLSACATVTNDPLARAEYERINDPLEPLNRKVALFNSGVQKVAFDPIAAAYNTLPQGFRTMINSFFRNLSEPRNIMNALLQGEPQAAGISLGRFMTNSTIGLGGLIEVTGADNYHPKDFGGTLAVWTGKQSAYLKLPLLGPSSVTDTMGMFVDSLYGLPNVQARRTGSTTIVLTTNAVNSVHQYAKIADDLQDIRQNSPDPYIVIRSNYRQMRQRSIFSDSTALSDDNALNNIE